MNKSIFAKIFELENCQVLITKDYEDDAFKVVQTSDFDEVRPAITLGFKSELDRDECFKNYNQSNAELFIKSISKMIGMFA